MASRSTISIGMRLRRLEAKHFSGRSASRRSPAGRLVSAARNTSRSSVTLPGQRFVMPQSLPEDLAVDVASRLRYAAEAADVDMAWLERPLDAEFSLIQQRQADAGLGWLATAPEALPAPLDAMSLGEFEPEVWIPATHPAACRGTISLGELAGMTVIYGPHRAEPVTYDAWIRVLRAVEPRLDFTDSPLRHSLPMALAFAATSDRPAAVLTSPQHRGLARTGRARSGRRPSRDGPRSDRRIMSNRRGGLGLERRPAAPAPAGPLRHRRQHRRLTLLPAAEPRSSGAVPPESKHETMTRHCDRGNTGRLARGAGCTTAR